MRNPFAVGVTAAAVVICAGLLAPSPARAQLPTEPVERARVIAEMRQNFARQLTIWIDRGGSSPRSDRATCSSIPCSHQTRAASPSSERISTRKRAISASWTSRAEVCPVDGESGARTRCLSSVVARRQSDRLRRPAQRTLQHLPQIGGWSRDRGAGVRKQHARRAQRLVGRCPLSHVLFQRPQGRRDIRVAARGRTQRKSIEVFRSTSQLANPHLSPDNRFISYVSNESGRNEIYVRRVDA